MSKEPPVDTWGVEDVVAFQATDHVVRLEGFEADDTATIFLVSSVSGKYGIFVEGPNAE